MTLLAGYCSCYGEITRVVHRYRTGLTLRGIDNITEGAVLTVSRKLYDEGLADGGSWVHFASYGDPIFDAVLEHFNGFALPACVRRIAVPVPGLEDAEMVGYAVACRGSGGSTEVRLVRAWADLDGLQPAETVSPTEAEVSPLREQLGRMARDELEPFLAAERIERANIRAAHAREMLNYLVARGLLEVRARHAGEGALYGPVLREVESLYEDRERVNLPDLPADLLRPVQGVCFLNVRCPMSVTKPSCMFRSFWQDCCKCSQPPGGQHEGAEERTPGRYGYGPPAA